MRGAGIEIRVYGADPDRAEARARRARPYRTGRQHGQATRAARMPYRRAERLHLRAEPGDLTALASRKPYFNHIGLKFRQHRRFWCNEFERGAASAPTEVWNDFSERRPDCCFPGCAAGGRLLVVALLFGEQTARAIAPAPGRHRVGDYRRRPPAGAIPGRARHHDRCRSPSADGSRRATAPMPPTSPPAALPASGTPPFPARAARWRRRRPSSAPVSAPGRCAAPRRSTASSRGTWRASTLALYDVSGAVLARLYSSGGERFDGQTATGVPISLSR